MTTLQENEASIQFEGLGSGAHELFGGTQANFLINVPGRSDREIAVLVNDPTMEFLAERLGVENTQEFRDRAAEVVGRLWITRAMDRGLRVPPAITISRNLLEQNPDFVTEVEAALRATAA